MTIAISRSGKLDERKIMYSLLKGVRLIEGTAKIQAQVIGRGLLSRQSNS